MLVVGNKDSVIFEKNPAIKITHIHKVHTGIDCFSYIGLKLWKFFHEKIKKANRLETIILIHLKV